MKHTNASVQSGTSILPSGGSSGWYRDLSRTSNDHFRAVASNFNLARSVCSLFETILMYADRKTFEFGVFDVVLIIAQLLVKSLTTRATPLSWFHEKRRRWLIPVKICATCSLAFLYGCLNESPALYLKKSLKDNSFRGSVYRGRENTYRDRRRVDFSRWAQHYSIARKRRPAQA